jgi:hypothetical protein
MDGQDKNNVLDIMCTMYMFLFNGVIFKKKDISTFYIQVFGFL